MARQAAGRTLRAGAGFAHWADMGAIAAFMLIADAAATLGSPQPQRLAGGATVVRAVASPGAPPFERLGPAPAIVTGSGLRLAGVPADPQAPRPRIVPIY